MGPPTFYAEENIAHWTWSDRKQRGEFGTEMVFGTSNPFIPCAVGREPPGVEKVAPGWNIMVRREFGKNK
jgi:hypothetical protein